MTNRAPLIVAIVLLLPVLYVGSYLALMVPDGYLYRRTFVIKGQLYTKDSWETYRIQGWWVERTFWPLEQIDRKMRPWAWDGKISPRK